MPSYAHLTQFSATDPLPLTLGPVVRPPTPAPAPCPLQAFERGDHGWMDETPSLLRALEWQAANYVGARLERRTLEA